MRLGKHMLSIRSIFSRSFAEKCADCCWSCHKKLPSKDCDFFCGNCHKIQPPHCHNYFSLFDQAETYDIDQQKLDKLYKNYQRLVHPDKFYRSSKEEKIFSDKVTTCVNEGYKTLSDPIKRGEYFLDIKNIKFSKDVPPDFLIDVLDLHEQIDGTKDTSELVKLFQQIQKRIKDENIILMDCLRIVDGQVKDPKGAGTSLSKMRYLQRIHDSLREKLPLDLI